VWSESYTKRVHNPSPPFTSDELFLGRLSGEVLGTRGTVPSGHNQSNGSRIGKNVPGSALYESKDDVPP